MNWIKKMTERNLTGSIPNSFFWMARPELTQFESSTFLLFFSKLTSLIKRERAFEFHFSTFFCCLRDSRQWRGRPLLLTILILFWSMVRQNLRFQRFLKDPRAKWRFHNYILSHILQQIFWRQIWHNQQQISIIIKMGALHPIFFMLAPGLGQPGRGLPLKSPGLLSWRGREKLHAGRSKIDNGPAKSKPCKA